MANRTYEDVIKKRLDQCKTEEERFAVLTEILADQTRLLEHILNSLSLSTQKKIWREVGLKEFLN